MILQNFTNDFIKVLIFLICVLVEDCTIVNLICKDATTECKNTIGILYVYLVIYCYSGKFM